MEEEHTLTQQFKNKIVYNSEAHHIPLEFIFKKLSIASFRDLLEYEHIANLTQHLKDIPHYLEQHQMEGHLQSKRVDVKQLLEIYRKFQTQVISIIGTRPFYLGIDKTYMQQTVAGAEVVIEHEREYSLKWSRKYAKGEVQLIDFVKLYKFDELVIIGRGQAGSKEFSGMKLHNNQLFLALEMGIWRHGSPVVNLTIKLEEGKTRVYYRQFENKKFLRGEIRYIEGDEIRRYYEGEASTLRTSAT